MIRNIKCEVNQIDALLDIYIYIYILFNLILLFYIFIS